MGKFYRNLAQDIDSSVNRDFYGKTANDREVPSEDVKKYLLATSDFAKGMQDDINLYVTCDRLNNVSFRKKLDPTAKNIFRKQNPLAFKDISTFDTQKPIVGSLLHELDIGKKDVASTLIKKAPNTIDINIQSRLNALKENLISFNLNINNDYNNDNFLPPRPPPSPPLSPPKQDNFF